ncbi:MAG: sugar ABC transporter substrate-binding protein [Anaerolineae bacterium]|nr:sugar ABC transporter substrate-binding protein [Anaerolineae bacterium]
MEKRAMTRRRFMTGALAGASSAVLAACAVTPQVVEKEVEKVVKETVVVEVEKLVTATLSPELEGNIIYTWWGSGTRKVARDKALELFADRYPRITVQSVQITANYKDKVLTMIAGGTPPDVMQTDNYDITAYAAKGTARPLDDLVQRDSFDLSIFWPQSLEEPTWEGKLYGLPFMGSPRIVYFNKDLFDAAGVTTPDQLWEAGEWTWDALIETANALTGRDASGNITQFGFQADTWHAALAPWIWQNDGQMLSEDHKVFRENEPEAVEAVAFQQGLIHKHRVAPKAEEQEGIDLFATGKLAMLVSWRGSCIVYRSYKFNWEVAPMPVGPQRKVTLYKGNCMAMTSDSKQVDAAWTLMKFLESKEADLLWVMAGDAVPTRINLDVFMSSTPPTNNQYFFEPFEQDYAQFLPLNPHWPEWDTVVNQKLSRVFLENEDVGIVMDELKPEVEAILAQPF